MQAKIADQYHQIPTCFVHNVHEQLMRNCLDAPHRLGRACMYLDCTPAEMQYLACMHQDSASHAAGFIVRASVNSFLPQKFLVNDIACSIVLVNNISGVLGWRSNTPDPASEMLASCADANGLRVIPAASL